MRRVFTWLLLGLASTVSAAISPTSRPLNGLTITNVYDSLWRRTSVALDSQSATLTQFGCDPVSQLVGITNGVNTALYGYLTNSRLARVKVRGKKGAN